jgi:hypothetical protein
MEASLLHRENDFIFQPLLPEVISGLDRSHSSRHLGFDKGRLVATEYLELLGEEGLGWETGAPISNRDGSAPLPPRSTPHETRTVAMNILATTRSSAEPRFVFTGLGKLASLGHQLKCRTLFERFGLAPNS